MQGIERRVRNLIGKDLDVMVMALRDIVLGIPPHERSALAGIPITTRDRIEAFKVLVDRGWGKPKAIVQVSEARPGDDLTLLSTSELDDLMREAELEDGDEPDGADASRTLTS